MKRFLFLCVLCVSLSTLQSCNDASILGANILPDDENLEVAFLDDIELKATTVRKDSVRVYDPDPSFQPGRYIIGRVEDPVFGISTSNIYSQFELLTTNPDFSNAVLDSVVLVVAYSTGGHYGDLTKPYTLKVKEVSEYMNPELEYYSHQTFSTYNSILGQKTFVPNVTDSVEVSGVMLAPHIRIPIDNALGNRLFTAADTTVFDNDDLFTNYFYGLELEGSLNDNKAILGLELLDNISQLVFYYKEDTTQQVFALRAKSGSTKTMHFNHTYDKGIYASINPFVNNSTLGDSLVFLQAMEGYDVEIEMPSIMDLSNIIVNKAELVVSVAQNANSSVFPLPEQLILSRESEDGTDPILIEDVTVSLNRTSSFAGLFGGQPEENSTSGETIMEYHMNISGFLQDVLSGKIENSKLYLSIYPKPDQASRLILGGAKHSKYKMKINLTYTKLE